MNKTDRTLLEAAAKAAGIELFAVFGPVSNFEGFRAKREDGDTWNPLTDDGDALRLAVKLGIGVLFDVQDEKITAYQQQPCDGYFVEFADDDGPLAATRRAIVRAAASMVVKT